MIGKSFIPRKNYMRIKCIILFLFNFKIHKKTYKHNDELHKHIKTILFEKTNEIPAN